MDDTCKAKECKLHELLGGTPEQCPNFIQTAWTSQETGVSKLVRDCAPIRTMLMIQELVNRTLGLQQAQEQQRNESHVVVDIVKKALTQRIKRGPDITQRLEDTSR